MKKIKILYTIPNFDTAGSGKVVYDLIKGLDKTIFAPEICCAHTKGAFFKDIERLGVPIHVFNYYSNYRPFISLPSRIWRVSRFFRKHQFDIIHSWHWSSDITEPLAAKLAGTPFVYTKKAMGWGNKAWCWRSQLSAKIITINSDMNTFFKSMIQKVVQIPLGIDLKQYRPLEKAYHTPCGLTFNKGDFVIVSIANLAPVKGIEVLIEAVIKLNNPNVKVVHVGANNNDYGNKLKAQYAHLDQVFFINKVSDVRPYLAIADVFVIPTKNEGRKEGLPVAPMEAMACQRLVLGSHISGIKDLLSPFNNLLFEPNNIVELENKLNCIMELSEAERVNLAIQLRQRIERQFNLTSCVEQHQKLYKRLVN
ncbi:glycosyltransferase [Mangrovimonas cancribranchiae]|uniref:Glycosyltransferase n=1 Tax=Mangrovimonas cancribranchiae TaxID=3080055 RepID=A0AAU6P109_9FLAO